MENKKTADFETVSFDSQYNRSIEQPNPDQWMLDHFAGLAMQGIISAGSTMREIGGEYTNWSEKDRFPVNKLAKESYLIAKAMLKARKELSND